MKIAITGVTGHFGYEVLEDLIKLGMQRENLIALARNPEKAKDLIKDSAEIRRADFDDYNSLEKALVNVDRVLLVSTRESDPIKRAEQHINVIKAAKKNNVSLLVYTSSINPEKTQIGKAHVLTENYLEKSGVPYIILRNNYYLEVRENDIKNAIADKPIITSIGDGKIGYALRSEYALAAAKVLKGNFAVNKIYNLSDNVVTYNQFAQALEKVLNKKVEIKNITDEQMQDFMIRAGINENVAKTMAATYKALRLGAVDVQSSDFETILGRKPKDLERSLGILINQIKKE